MKDIEQYCCPAVMASCAQGHCVQWACDTCSWSPGPVPGEISPERNSEQLQWRMLRLESNQHKPMGKPENIRERLGSLCHFRRHVFSLHRCKGRIQQEERLNHWLLESQPVGARQSEWTFLLVTSGGVCGPGRSTGLGSWFPLSYLWPMWPCVSYLIALTLAFLKSSRITYLIWLSRGCNAIIFSSIVKALSKCW